MSLGYVKIATCVNKVGVCDVEFNKEQIKKGIDRAVSSEVQVLVFPTLSLTGSTCGDLFLSKTLLDNARSAIKELALYTLNKNIIVFVGLPLEIDGKVYNVTSALTDGIILGFSAKHSNINDGVFSDFDSEIGYVTFGQKGGDIIPVSKNIIYVDAGSGLKICVENDSDTDVLFAPSEIGCANGVNLVVNPTATEEFSGRFSRLCEKLKERSLRLTCGYINVNAGDGESTTDGAYSGSSVVYENGECVSLNAPFENDFCTSYIDLTALSYARSNRKATNTTCLKNLIHYVGFSLDISKVKCDRKYNKTPFIKAGEEELLLDIQAHALKKRIEHTNSKSVVLGLSGGLDSTLALIVAVRAIKLCNRPEKDVLAITMPCFGTTGRTFDNSVKLAKSYGVTLKKVDIAKSVKRHLKDIGHSENLHDPAYENAQARERTQVLMDTANMCGGLVVGTGDLSELALGWATYNGDHMSMYAVNGSVPKTLVRHLVEYTAKNSKGKLKSVLLDVLDTPVSPELIPAENGKIKQVTEDIVGPYVLHDFFLYMFIEKGFTPEKIYYSAVNSFDGDFDKKTILKWLKTFMRRFFNQQFKRSCMPDGVKVTEISLSPRSGFKMPSDALSKLWLDELENIQI